MVKRVSNGVPWLAALAVAGFAGVMIWHFAGGGRGTAGAALPMPRTGEVDFRFQTLSAFEMARIPLATRFDPPLGGDHGSLTYNAQKFWEMNDKRGGHHTGDDLNGIGGMNTDLGDPVFCTADGLVLYTGEPSPGWGNMVIVGHKTTDGRVLQSMYAHLYRIDVTRGQLLARRQILGQVGTANGNYLAHLHFEMRESDGVVIGSGYAQHPLDHLDPLGTVAALRNAAPDDLSVSPLNVMVAEGK